MQKTHKNSITDISHMPSLFGVESFSRYGSVKDRSKLGDNRNDPIKSSLGWELYQMVPIHWHFSEWLHCWNANVFEPPDTAVRLRRFD